MKVIEEIKDFYKIVQFDTFRKTPNVNFDLIPLELFTNIGSLDRVIHKNNAMSPGPVGDIKRPWYMHNFQDDNLVVFGGTRFVEIYTPEHGRIESFTVTSDKVFRGDMLIAEGSVLLIWPRKVFHRILSGTDGSASLNVAVHYDGFDIRTNFDVFDLNTENGDYKVIRKGYEDQM
ncbi:MAG: hypothetical protein ACYCYI_03655 [Saccharofermentanales bacterium]